MISAKAVTAEVSLLANKNRWQEADTVSSPNRWNTEVKHTTTYGIFAETARNGRPITLTLFPSQNSRLRLSCARNVLHCAKGASVENRSRSESHTGRSVWMEPNFTDTRGKGSPTPFF
jgi:hypothetical protein